MRRVRVTLVLLGVLSLAWGGWLLLSRQDPGQVLGVAIWLAAVVVVHDGLVSALSAVRHRLRRSVPTGEPHERTP